MRAMDRASAPDRTVPSSPPLPGLRLYGTLGCHLCEQTKADLGRILTERASLGLAVPQMVEVDIADDAALTAAFGESIPVVELGQRRLELATSPARLRSLLHDVLDASDA